MHTSIYVALLWGVSNSSPPPPHTHTHTLQNVSYAYGSPMSPLMSRCHCISHPPFQWFLFLGWGLFFLGGGDHWIILKFLLSSKCIPILSLFPSFHYLQPNCTCYRPFPILSSLSVFFFNSPYVDGICFFPLQKTICLAHWITYCPLGYFVIYTTWQISLHACPLLVTESLQVWVSYTPIL